MDGRTRLEIMQAVSTAIEQALEGNRECWLSGKELCKQFQFFTPNWLKTYGHLLPRVQARVLSDGGTVRTTSWAYPRNRIQRMVNEGRLDFHLKERCEYRPTNNN